MSLTIKTVLLLIAAILMAISAFVDTTRADLFKLGWAFAVLSLVVG